MPNKESTLPTIQIYPRSFNFMLPFHIRLAHRWPTRRVADSFSLLLFAPFPLDTLRDCQNTTIPKLRGKSLAKIVPADSLWGG